MQNNTREFSDEMLLKAILPPPSAKMKEDRFTANHDAAECRPCSGICNGPHGCKGF